MAEFPADHWFIIEGNLSTHVNRKTKLALTTWPEIPIHEMPPMFWTTARGK